MKIAIITGASSGLGREFVRQTAAAFPEVECFWLIARRRERLEEMARGLKGKQVKCLSLDLCDPASFAFIEEKLRLEKPEVSLLINNAGCGYLGYVGEMETASQTRMVDLNIRALTAVTNMTVPHMPRGSHLINVSSVASFCANPRMTVYSSSKAYVSAFTLGISEELRRKGVTVTAVCPGPMKTEFLDVGGITGHSKMFQMLPYCDQVKVVAGVLRAAKAGHTFYTPRAFFKFYRFVAKVLPQKVMVKITKT